MAELICKLKDRRIGQVGIDKTITTIGRDPDNDMIIDNAGVSRCHASVCWEDGEWVLRDEGSANGIFLHGSRVTQAALTEGDTIKIGKFRVVFTEAGGVPIAELKEVTRETRAAERTPMSTMFMTDKDLQNLLRAQAEEAQAASPITRAPSQPIAAPRRRDTPTDLPGVRRPARAAGSGAFRVDPRPSAGPTWRQLIVAAVVASALTAGVLYLLST